MLRTIAPQRKGRSLDEDASSSNVSDVTGPSGGTHVAKVDGAASGLTEQVDDTDAGPPVTARRGKLGKLCPAKETRIYRRHGARGG